MSPTHDMIIDNSTGANVRADINNALAALVSNSSSSSEPATKYAYMWWADTTNGVLKIRNSANNGWVELLQLDGTITLEDGTVSAPGLAFRDDPNTGLFSSAADTFNVATGGVERMELGATTIFNEDGADVDFRIEGDTEANLFYVDAGNDRIGIGTASPESVLHVSNAVAAGSDNFALRIQNPTNASDARVGIFFHVNAVTGSGSDGAYIESANSGSDNGDIRFGNITNLTKTERMRIDSSGRLLIGHSSNFSGFALQVLGSDENTSSLSLSRFKANSSSSVLEFHKSRNNSVGSNTLVQNNDAVGVIRFKAADGTDFSQVADIQAAIDGTPGDNDTPGRLVFSTTADGSQFTTERMRIDSSGNVGIGTSSPTAPLTVGDSNGASSVGGNYLLLKRTSGTTNYIAAPNADAVLDISADETIRFGTVNTADFNSTERMRIDASGRVGIGTASPSTLLELSGGGNTVLTINTGNNSGDNSQIAFGDSADADVGFINYDHGTHIMQFGVAASERMRIDSSGIVYVGTTGVGGGSGGVRLQHPDNGSSRFGTTITSGTKTLIQFISNGANNIVGSISVATSSTSFNTSSDYRLKENEVLISDGITRLKQLKPYRFNWKTDSSTIVDGFFAHEVSSIVPESITGTKDAVAVQEDVDKGIADAIGDPIYQGIDQRKLVPLLVAAVQELIGKVETLEAA